MAIFTAIKNKNQTPKDMIRTMLYMMDDKKTIADGVILNSGVNCNVYSSYLEMKTTKQQYRKTDKRQFYQFVQSFPEDTKLSPEEVHRLGVEFAEKQFGNFECLVSTHCNTENLHNHILVNSVSYKDGKKLHQNHDALMEHRRVNDEICLQYGEEILPKYDKKKKYQNIKASEYRAALQGNSWKCRLINDIEDALLYSSDRESFIKNMEYEGYHVNWTDTRKYITYTTPDGHKCRDNKLHDETYLKENLEKLFEFRQATGFVPLTYEPENGWLGEMQEHGFGQTIGNELLTFGKNVEDMQNDLANQKAEIWTGAKQKQREKLKKLALGQKISMVQNQEY